MHRSEFFTKTPFGKRSIGMNEQIKIMTFNHALKSKNDEGRLYEALDKLKELQDPQLLADAKGSQPTPLGSWSGWAW